MDYVRIILRRWWIIVLLVVLSMGSAYVFSRLQTRSIARPRRS
jgi:uncharacterized protein involved in exopolysaccharide biosynthesis